LLAKKETEEEKAKRLHDEALIAKQNTTHWGKGILEEEDEDEESSDSENNDDDHDEFYHDEHDDKIVDTDEFYHDENDNNIVDTEKEDEGDDDDDDDVNNEKKKKGEKRRPTQLIMSSVNIIQHNQDVVTSRNILKQFPEFLKHLLPYIADRTVFNAIALSNKAIYQRSKILVPPWPIDFLLRHPDGSREEWGYANELIFSPDGTQIACSVICKIGKEFKQKIAIFDQRRGLLYFRFRTHQGDDVERINDNNNNNTGKEIDSGWFSGSHMMGGSYTIHPKFCDNYLVTTGDDGFVRIWDYKNIAASRDFNYVELVEEFDALGRSDGHWSNRIINILTCDRFVAVLCVTNNVSHILLKDIHNNGKLIKLIDVPGSVSVGLIAITLIDGHPSIFISSRDIDGNSSVQIWCPYDRNSLDTILEVSDATIVNSVFSRDYSMLVLVTTAGRRPNYKEEKVTLYSFDKDKSISKLSLQKSFIKKATNKDLIDEVIQFSPDDTFISYYDTENGLTCWDVTTGDDITDNIEINHDEYERKNCNVHEFSPVDHQRLILVDEDKGGHYISSFMEKKSVKQKSIKRQKI